MAVIRFGSEPVGQKFCGRRLGAFLAGHMPRHEMIKHDFREPFLIFFVAARIGRHVRQDQNPRRRDALFERGQLFVVQNGGAWHAFS